ncbi:hypothetical protein RvY_18744-2 [Ramazzottius varieornatus]|nr:hypothetical protein RvY_18744-2 [Ramazzottius varieornatus]
MMMESSVCCPQSRPIPTPWTRPCYHTTLTVMPRITKVKSFWAATAAPTKHRRTEAAPAALASAMSLTRTSCKGICRIVVSLVGRS